MASFDPESLLAPISEGAPAGENLEYDPAFAALERALVGKPEQQIGETIVAGEPPEWESVVRQAAELLTRSKDLRAAMPLAQALLLRRGITGFRDGLGVVRGLLDRYWESVFPELDREDDNDPTIRINALAGLSEPAILLAVRSAPLGVHRSVGPVSLRDAQAAALGTPTADGRKLEMSSVEAVFAEADLAALEGTVAALREALDHVKGIEAAFDAAGARGPELSQLIQVLRETLAFVGPRLERRQPRQESVAGGADAEGAGLGGGGARRAGEITSREDVVRALDEICGYYARYEPSSPLPLLLARCKRLVSMSFIDIVKDMVPEALTLVETIAGKQETNDS